MLKGHNIRRLNPRPARARSWALAMTELPSVSGSAEEAAFPEKLVVLLRATPPFADQPESVWMIPVPGGRHQEPVLRLWLGAREPEPCFSLAISTPSRSRTTAT